MRALAVLAALAASALVAASIGRARTDEATILCKKNSLNLVTTGQLTIGTDNPAYPPYFEGGAPKGSKWKVNDPATAKGFESATAYAVATRLGFARDDVSWIAVPFSQSFRPGSKPFDFYLAQVSISPERAKAVTFSRPYFTVNQAVVALKGNKIANVKTVAGLRSGRLGAPIGTTSYSYIVRYIKPTQKPRVYDSLNDALSALKAKQVDGVVVDFPTSYYVANVQLEGAKIVGRLPTRGATEHFGLVFQKGNSLAACVSEALTALDRSGTLARIERTWISAKARAPFLK